MIYLSKGMVQEKSTEQLLFVWHCGTKFELTGTEAAMWLNGRLRFAKVRDAKEQRAVDRLYKLHLVEMEQKEDSLARYRIMTRCIFCPVKTKRFVFMQDLERRLLYWLKHAGIRLTVAELTYLMEEGIEPSKDLLYRNNRQKLIERIYTKNNIADNLLEIQMETSTCRDDTVAALMNLLKRKQLLIL